jgi:hypothetical protein
VNVDCPICSDDVTCYVHQGHVEHLACANGCHTRYSDDERADVEQAAKDMADTARNELEFGHLELCGYTERMRRFG